MTFEGDGDDPCEEPPHPYERISHPDRSLSVRSPEKHGEIETSLRRILERTDAFVTFSDTASDKFVELIEADRSLWLVVSAQTLEPDEWQRAADYFNRIGLAVELDYPDEDSDSVAVATQASFEAELGTDVSAAAQIVLDLFEEVYRLRSFELKIDEQGKYF